MAQPEAVPHGGVDLNCLSNSASLMHVKIECGYLGLIMTTCLAVKRPFSAFQPRPVGSQKIELHRLAQIARCTCPPL
jgi:hypothetical protein